MGEHKYLRQLDWHTHQVVHCTQGAYLSREKEREGHTSIDCCELGAYSNELERVVRVIHGGVVAFGRTVVPHGDDRGVNPTLSLTMEGLMQFV